MGNEDRLTPPFPLKLKRPKQRFVVCDFDGHKRTIVRTVRKRFVQRIVEDNGHQKPYKYKGEIKFFGQHRTVIGYLTDGFEWSHIVLSNDEYAELFLVKR